MVGRGTHPMNPGRTPLLRFGNDFSPPACSRVRQNAGGTDPRSGERGYGSAAVDTAGVAGHLPLPDYLAAAIQLDDLPVGGDQGMAVGQPCHATGAGDSALPEDFPGCIDFDD